MNFETIRAAIVARFDSQWRNASNTGPLFPVEHENRPFQQPPNATWARFSVRFGERDNAAVGKENPRTVGMVFLQIFQREGHGGKDARAAADKLGEIFDNVELPMGGTDIERISFLLVNLTTVGRTQDGWHQQNASVTFWADNIHPQSFEGGSGGEGGNYQQSLLFFGLNPAA